MAVNLDAQTFLRRIDILQRLPAQGSGRITARDLITPLQAAGYPVEKRTIERDLEFLRDGSAWLGQVVCENCRGRAEFDHTRRPARDQHDRG